MSGATQRLSIDAANALIRSALQSSGVPAGTAGSVAHAPVAAEAEGQSGHRFSRLSDYAAQVQSGKINAQAIPALSAVQPAALTVDANFGFAYPALNMGIAALTDAANRLGSATVAIRRSHHCGALSIHVEKIAEAGLVGLMVANAPASIAPWGATQALFGTNPIAFAAPRPDGPPLIIDLFLSRVARGKVMHARKTGQSIPEGSALDRDGNPTTDPETALDGTMVPIGEAKGTALALMVEVLAAAFTGANFSRDSGSFFTAEGDQPGTGQFLAAFKPADGPAFLTRIEMLLDTIEAMDGARLPGSRRTEQVEKACRNGICVPTAYVEAARNLALAGHEHPNPAKASSDPS